MGRVEWSMWANEHALLSNIVIISGGIIGVAGSFTRWPIGAYSIILGVVLFLVEYPRGERSKGSTEERKFQHLLTRLNTLLGPLTQNYYVRFVLYLLTSIPCYFLLPTFIGALSNLVTAIVYLIAALKGESWRPIHRAQAASSGAQVIQPPSRPPPRTPEQRRV